MALWIIPLIVLLVIIAAYFAANRLMTRRIAAKHGGEAGRAISDEREPIPSAHLITDEERPLGDTPEAHGSINPRDIPLDNPARHEAENQADGETRGNVEGAQGGTTEHGTKAERADLRR